MILLLKMDDCLPQARKAAAVSASASVAGHKEAGTEPPQATVALRKALRKQAKEERAAAAASGPTEEE